MSEDLKNKPEALTATLVIEKLKEYYNVKTANEVSEKLGNIAQSNVSRAIKNDNVRLLITKIRKAGIFDEIFK
jgi:hypothetical protein